MHLPSRLEFASFLQYSPQGKSQTSRASKTICLAVKNDSPLLTRFGGEKKLVPAIRTAVGMVQRFKTSSHLFDDFLGPDRILIPVPRSAPLSRADALWPARRICDELVSQSLGAEVLPALIRQAAVTKSASAAKGSRPLPPAHFESTTVAAEMPISHKRKITIVDDVITRGSTFVGMQPHVLEAFPGYDIRCFALIRTMSGIEIETFEAPAVGEIDYSGNYLHREP